MEPTDPRSMPTERLELWTARGRDILAGDPSARIKQRQAELEAELERRSAIK